MDSARHKKTMRHAWQPISPVALTANFLCNTTSLNQVPDRFGIKRAVAQPMHQAASRTTMWSRDASVQTYKQPFFQEMLKAKKTVKIHAWCKNPGIVPRLKGLRKINFPLQQRSFYRCHIRKNHSKLSTYLQLPSPSLAIIKEWRGRKKRNPTTREEKTKRYIYLPNVLFWTYPARYTPSSPSKIENYAQHNPY